MATYYPASSNERDYVLMNYSRELSPNSYSEAPMNYSRELSPNSYSEAPVLPGTMMYMSYSSSSGPYPDTSLGNSQQQNTGIGIPPVEVLDSTVLHHEFLSNLGGSRIGEHNFTAWRDGRNVMMLMQPTGGDTGNLHGSQYVQGQGLSLSLSPQHSSGIQNSTLQYRNHDPSVSSFLSPNTSVSGENLSVRDDVNSQSKQSRNTEYMQPDFQVSGSDMMEGDVSPYVITNIARNIPNSKYLKAAREVLDEVVNVRSALKEHDSKKDMKGIPKEVDGVAKNVASMASASSNAQGSISNPTELSSSEKQEVQNKMTKLLSMLDEADRRYRQYYHQMQIVVSSFDVVAGCGAVKPYTALALQTISRHFRCMRDALNRQIRVTQKSLGEHDGSANSRGVGISRLRFVDQQLRQERALQHLGMMQQHTWRPQRGPPESSVSILRAWLFEHFLHPYPKDSDKIMLAREAGLTRSQVSNWFINARVRLWKPMVEEMYKEEAADAVVDSSFSSDVVTKATNKDLKISEDRGEDVQNSPTISTMKCSTVQLSASNTSHVSDVEMVGPCTESVFNILNCAENETHYKVGISREDQRPNVTEYSIIPQTMVQPNERVMAMYSIPELGRFENTNGVSLTLGLHRCEDGNIPKSVGTHHNFVSVRREDVYDPAATQVGTAETVDFDCMNSGNGKNKFGSSHLLHDFVA